MIAGGNATIIVANMDTSVHFYTEVLGLELAERFGDHWATVSAGEGLTIGIHPTSARYPHPGTKGSVVLGLDLEIPIDEAVSRLASRGAEVQGSVVRTEAGSFVHLEDPDGNDLYLWERVKWGG